MNNNENLNANIETKPIEENNNEQNNKNETKKIVSQFKFIFSTGISFFIWNYVILILFNLFIQSITANFSNSLALSLVVYHFIWILTSIITIMLSYNSNKKAKVEDNKHNLTKNILLGIFYIFIIVVNFENILSHLELDLITSMIMLLLHIALIWYFNNKFYSKYIDNTKIERNDIIVLLISIGIILILIVANNFVLNKKYTMTCVRANGDNINISFNSQGIKNVKINNEDMSEDKLLLYKTNFISEFAWIQIANENESQSEIIEEYMEEVSEFEEEHEEYRARCSDED